MVDSLDLAPPVDAPVEERSIVRAKRDLIIVAYNIKQARDLVEAGAPVGTRVRPFFFKRLQSEAREKMVTAIEAKRFGAGSAEDYRLSWNRGENLFVICYATSDQPGF